MVLVVGWTFKMLKITRFCGECKTKRKMTHDGTESHSEVMQYFTCEKGHHCKVFVSKILMKTLQGRQLYL